MDPMPSRRERRKSAWMFSRKRYARALKDPDFHREFQKLVGDEVEPVMPEEVTRANPRDSS
jgi:hypothetical protein